VDPEATTDVEQLSKDHVLVRRNGQGREDPEKAATADTDDTGSTKHSEVDQR
jgi:hypothetical protein